VGGTSGFGARGDRFVLASRAVGDSFTGGDGKQRLGRLFGALVDGDGGVRSRTAARYDRHTAHGGDRLTASRNNGHIARGGRHAAGRDAWYTAGRGGHSRGDVARRRLYNRGDVGRRRLYNGGDVARRRLLRGRASCSNSRNGDISVLHREGKTLVASVVALVDKLVL
jgi:hypothetical protein